MSLTGPPWAHNTERSGPNRDVPVIWTAEVPPADSENWHVASDEEYDAYETYWRLKEEDDD